MVRSRKPPDQVSLKVKIVYKPKDSCVVFSPEDRMNFAHFCALLMTIDRQSKAKKENEIYEELPQKYENRIKGSLISGPYFIMIQLLIYLTLSFVNILKF